MEDLQNRSRPAETLNAPAILSDAFNISPLPADKALESVEGGVMIELTRLNGNPLYVNCDLIKWAEAAPDTLLTLINGEKIVVRESCAEVVERVQTHRLLLLTALLKLIPDPETFLRAAAAATVPGAYSRTTPESRPEGRPASLNGNDREGADGG